MPSGAHYRVNQAGNPVPNGTQDVARVDIWQGNVIHMVGDSTSGQTGPSWTITSWPFGATHTQPTNPTTFDASFTPGTPGTYRVSFAVNDGAGANLRTFIFAVTRDSVGLVIDGGVREPAFGETDVDDTSASNDRGYARSYELAMPFQVPTADDRTALRAMKAVRHKQVHLLGLASKGDGLGGPFYWDAASTDDDDDTSVIQPTGLATGRWKRSITAGVAGSVAFQIAGSDASPQPVTLDFPNAVTARESSTTLSVIALSLQDATVDLADPQPWKLDFESGFSVDTSRSDHTAHVGVSFPTPPSQNYFADVWTDGSFVPVLDPANFFVSIIYVTGPGASCLLPTDPMNRYMSIWLNPSSTDPIVVGPFVGATTVTLDFVSGVGHQSCVDVFQDQNTGEWVAYRTYPRAIPNP